MGSSCTPHSLTTVPGPQDRPPLVLVVEAGQIEELGPGAGRPLELDRLDDSVLLLAFVVDEPHGAVTQRQTEVVSEAVVGNREQRPQRRNLGRAGLPIVEGGIVVTAEIGPDTVHALGPVHAENCANCQGVVRLGIPAVCCDR